MATQGRHWEPDHIHQQLTLFDIALDFSRYQNGQNLKPFHRIQMYALNEKETLEFIYFLSILTEH